MPAALHLSPLRVPDFSCLKVDRFVSSRLDVNLEGAGIAQWLERLTRDKVRGFESLLERRENFLLQGRLSVLILISVSVPPPCYRSSTQKIPVILPKVQVAGYT